MTPFTSLPQCQKALYISKLRSLLTPMSVAKVVLFKLHLDVSPQSPRLSRVNVDTANIRQTRLAYLKWSNAANCMGWFSILTLTRCISYHDWQALWTALDMLRGILVEKIVTLPCLSCFPSCRLVTLPCFNCLSKLPIQVPYKFCVKSPASIITTGYTYSLVVKTINAIESLLATFWQILTVSFLSD